MFQKSKYYKYLLFSIALNYVKISKKEIGEKWMKRKREKRRLAKNVSGFTLMEVIVVIAILGALTALALPKFTGVLANSQEKTDLANVRIVESAVELYHAEIGELPSTITTFEALITELNAKGYLKNTNIKPATSGRTFTYSATTGTVSVSPPFS